MFQLDFKSGVPLCDQIVNGIIKLKALGALKGGEQLPSVRVLASKFCINPNTVQKSYSILESEGIIYSVKGKGSFISDDETAASAVLHSAEQEFINAIKNAADLGLSKDRLKELVAQNFNRGAEK